MKELLQDDEDCLILTRRRMWLLCPPTPQIQMQRMHPRCHLVHLCCSLMRLTRALPQLNILSSLPGQEISACLELEDHTSGLDKWEPHDYRPHERTQLMAPSLLSQGLGRVGGPAWRRESSQDSRTHKATSLVTWARNLRGAAQRSPTQASASTDHSASHCYCWHLSRSVRAIVFWVCGAAAALQAARYRIALGVLKVELQGL